MNFLRDLFLPPAKSTIAPEIDGLFNFINITSLILLIGITAAIIYFVIKYRRKSENEVTPHITHNNKLEITWSVIPLILVMIVFGWAFNSFLNITTPPPNAYEIKVTGQKWLWRFEYPNGSSTTGELHVPVNRPVKLVMQSSDIIHSFYVPDFRIKQDLLPNQYTSTWFEATETGESRIFCSEYCGTGHSDMMGTVIVHKQKEFENWLKNSAQPVASDLPPAEAGKQLVQQNACLTCHSTDGSQMTGPSFKGLWGSTRTMQDGSQTEANANYIRESILQPKTKVVKGFQSVMPTYQGQLSDDDIDNIIEYLKQQN